MYLVEILLTTAFDLIVAALQYTHSLIFPWDYMTMFSRAIFQAAERPTAGNLVKSVRCPTPLKLSELANFNGISLKFKPPNQVA